MKNYYLWKELAVCQLSAAEWLNILCGCGLNCWSQRGMGRGGGDPAGSAPQPLREKSNLVFGFVRGFSQELEESYVNGDTEVSVCIKIENKNKENFGTHNSIMLSLISYYPAQELIYLYLHQPISASLGT